MQMKYQMIQDRMYGVVCLPNDIFAKLNSDFFISHCSDQTKYMCANEPEKQHLKSLGIETLDTCDWFELRRNSKYYEV